MRSTIAVTLLVAAAAVAACSDDSDGAAVATAAAPVVTTGAQPPNFGPELIGSSGFETNVEAEWLIEAQDPGQLARVAQDGEGNSFIEMSADLAESVPWPQVVQKRRVPISAGDRYRLAFRARSDDFGLVFASVAFEDASGDEFLGVGPGSVTVDDSDWTDYHFDFEAPDGAAAGYVILRLALNTAMTDEPFLSADVDDVSLRKIED